MKQKELKAIMAALTALEMADAAIAKQDRMAAWRAVARARGQLNAILPEQIANDLAAVLREVKWAGVYRSRDEAEQTIHELKREGNSVRTFWRTVRAGGAEVGVLAVVVYEKEAKA